MERDEQLTKTNLEMSSVLYNCRVRWGEEEALER